MSDFIKLTLHRHEGGRIAVEDRYWLKHHDGGKPLNEFDKAVLEQVFDTETDFDVQKIEHDIQHDKIDGKKLKFFSIYRIITYPFDKFLGYFLLDASARKYNSIVFGLYVNFILNRINVDELKKGLQNIKKSVKLT